MNLESKGNPKGTRKGMGLLTIIRKLKQRERETRLLILGLDNAGKTTIVAKLSGGSTEEISPTLGFNISTLCHKDYKLNLWDIGGQKSIRSYWRNYFESTDGLIWVVDSGDREDRLQDCKTELHSLLLEEVGRVLLDVFSWWVQEGLRGTVKTSISWG